MKKKIKNTGIILGIILALGLTSITAFALGADWAGTSHVNNITGQIVTIKGLFKTKNQTIVELENEKGDLGSDVTDLEDEVAQLDQQIAELEAAHAKAIKDLEAAHNTKVKGLEAVITQLKEDKRVLNATIVTKNDQITSLNDKIRLLEESNANKDTQIKEKDDKLIRALEDVKGIEASLKGIIEDNQ